ncbi:BTAD domain-containing putative transcriptional regulator [Nonomuraea basaltis]|uniref:BTAD domain-containing putative transcriptional regulator n=1 Tax=Nonomuraea basaltis TaxID=2495887 RepID=UPI00148728C0|nr:BTAD domain-containing putative transcriptional regulator [Nonomuraea basaltis]
MGFAFGVLGPLEVSFDGVPIVLKSAKQRALVAALLVDANRVVPVETLVARLWGVRPPAGVRNTLQNHVLRVRRLLGAYGAPAPVLSRPLGYLLQVADGALDLHRFDALCGLARAAAGDSVRVSELLREALALWRGLPLLDVDSDLLRQEVVPALAERRLGAIEARIEADLELGRHGEVLAELHELIGAHPMQERFWGQRMLALYRAGRQGEALRCYAEVREVLAEELGVDPGTELRELHRRILAADPALTASRPEGLAVAGELPAELTSFVGRERLIGQVRRLLDTARLVTLTGVGGVGKTRLALRVAAQIAGSSDVPASQPPAFHGAHPSAPWAEQPPAFQAAHPSAVRAALPSHSQEAALPPAAEGPSSQAFPGGVWLADFGPVTEPGRIDAAVAEALGIRDQSARPARDVLLRHLRDKRLLLVLDNCEHVAQAVAALLDVLLRAAPGLRVLATSRQPLGLPGEHVLPVPPLTVPAHDDGLAPEDGAAHRGVTACGDGRGDEAVRLLAERGAAAAPGFEVNDRNRAAAAQLCRRLDGMPLAIELAAVRLSALSLDEILERLDDRFRLLTGDPSDTTPAPRYQRTLQGVIDWSHGLCTEREQVLWARLAVFAGDFDLTAAESVCADEKIARRDVMDLLAGLVRKSIVNAYTADCRTTYRMLETIRQYGLHRLRELGQEVELRLRHRDHYLRTAAEAAAGWCSPREAEWLSRLRRELPNLRTAMEFCLTWPGEAEAGMRLAVHLTSAQTWFFNGTPAEGRHWLEAALAQRSVPATPLRVTATAFAVWIALCQGDLEAAGVLLAGCREQAGPPGDATVTFAEGAHALIRHADPAAIALLARARDEFRRGGRVGDTHLATLVWAMASVFLGDRETALAAGSEYLAEAKAHQGAWAMSWGLWGVGLAELRHGDPYRAMEVLRDSVGRQRALGDRWSPTWGVEVLAWAVAASGEHRPAVRLLGAADRLRQEFGVILVGPFRQAHLDVARELCLSLGPEPYAAAFAEGATAPDPFAEAIGRDGRP